MKKTIFDEMMDMMEDYLIQEIYRIKDDKTLRDNVKLSGISSLLVSALSFKLPVPVKLAKKAIEQIERGIDGAGNEEGTQEGI